MGIKLSKSPSSRSSSRSSSSSPTQLDPTVRSDRRASSLTGPVPRSLTAWSQANRGHGGHRHLAFGSLPSPEGSWSFKDDVALDVAEAPPQPEEEMLTSGPLSLTTRLEYTSLRKGESYNVFGLVSLQAAEDEMVVSAGSADGPRSPVDVTCVLDVSGSMSGQKIQLVKEAMLFVVSELQGNDRLSIVSFNHSAERCTRLERMNAEGKDDARQALMRLQASGGTSIVCGLDCGIACMEQRRQRNPVGAVFLLTDGHDSGAKHYVQSLVTRARAAQCSVYAFGFGEDHDTSVMSAISETAQTPFTFVERLESVKDAFAGAVGGLMSVAAQNIEVSIAPEGGCTLAAVHTHFTSRREEGGMVVVIPDAFAGERRDIVVELNVPSNADAADGQAPVLRAFAKYRAVREHATVQTAPIFLSVQRTAEPEGEPDVEVVAQRQRVQVTDALERAIQHGEEGDFILAQRVLKEQQEALGKSRVQTEVSKALIAEVEDAQERASSSSHWQKGGRAEMTDAMWMHRTQRCTNTSQACSNASRAKTSKALYIGARQQMSISHALA